MHCKDVCNFLCFCPCTHTQTTTQHTQTQAAARKAMIWWEENGGKKEIERRKRRKWWMCIMHNIERWEEWKNERVCDIFFGCAQWQSISNSVQIRAANPCNTMRYVVIFYIFLSIIHTSISHTDACIRLIKASYSSRTQHLLIDDLGEIPTKKEENWVENEQTGSWKWMLYEWEEEYRRSLPIGLDNLEFVQVRNWVEEEIGRKWNYTHPNGQSNETCVCWILFFLYFFNIFCIFVVL